MMETAAMADAPRDSAVPPSNEPEGVIDAARFTVLVEQHQHRLCNFLHRYTGNRHDAEDLVQDTFVKAFRHLHRYDNRHTFAAWLYTIARRTAYNHYRDRRPTEQLAFDVPAQDPAPDATVEHADRAASVWDDVRQLKSPYQEVLLMKYVDDLSIAEIARILGRTQTGVKILLFRARGQLRERQARTQP